MRLEPMRGLNQGRVSIETAFKPSGMESHTQRAHRGGRGLKGLVLAETATSRAWVAEGKAREEATRRA